MTTHHTAEADVDVDLFGNPVNVQARATTATVPAVNDMDIVQAVLADIVSERTPLHRDDTGTVRRCNGDDTAPASPAVTATVNQLIATRHLTTTRRHRACLNDDHDPEVVTTPAGHNAACRWNACTAPPRGDHPRGQHDRHGGAGTGHRIPRMDRQHRHPKRALGVPVARRGSRARRRTRRGPHRRHDLATVGPNHRSPPGRLGSPRPPGHRSASAVPQPNGELITYVPGTSNR